MAKGSNSGRSKKSYSSKPYDVSNSFVKRVASKVSSIIPQPAWLSKWFVSTNDEDSKSGAEDSEAEDVAESRSSKRPRIDLNRSFPADVFRVTTSSAEGVTSVRRLETEEENINEPTAGPSGMNRFQRNPAVATSTPASCSGDRPDSDRTFIRSRPLLSHLSQTTANTNFDRKVNGDDRSESSESTSGCSSLPPHQNLQSATHNSSAKLNTSIDNSAHLHSRRSLLLNRTRSPRITTPLSRRKSLFNVSAFSSPNLDADRSLSRGSVINSPFYSGRTGFGGASAYRRSSDLLNEFNVNRPSGVEVRPVNRDSSRNSSEMATMSQSARRILEALEQFASPLQDAKKMINSPASPVLASKRTHNDSAVCEKKPVSSNLQQLTIPTVPDIIKLRRREKLQDSMETARLIATSSKDNGYQLRVEEDHRTGKVLGKKNNLQDEETVKEVNLPNIVLPITNLPKFDFIVPPNPNTVSVSNRIYKFSSPIVIPDATRVNPSARTFSFRKPLIITISEDSSVSYDSSQVTVNAKLFPETSVVSNVPANSDLGSNNFKSVAQGKEHVNTGFHFSIQKGENSNIGCRDTVLTVQNQVSKSEFRNQESINPLTDFVKSYSDTWECDSCLIRNKMSATRCIACSTSRTVAQSKLPTTPVSFSQSSTSGSIRKTESEIKLSDSKTKLNSELRTDEKDVGKSEKSLGDFLKVQKNTWECPTCLIRNADTASKCQACETSKPMDVPKIIPFGDKFAKPSGMWECPTCMIQNKSEILKCVACEELKPGSAVKSKAESAVKISVNEAPEISKFKFGINASQDTITSSPNIQGFKFGETKADIPASSFTFGINNTANNVVQQKTDNCNVFISGISSGHESEKVRNPSTLVKHSSDTRIKSSFQTESPSLPETESNSAQFVEHKNVLSSNTEKTVTTSSADMKKLLMQSSALTSKAMNEADCTNVLKFSAEKPDSGNAASNLFSFGTKTKTITQTQSSNSENLAPAPNNISLNPPEDKVITSSETNNPTTSSPENNKSGSSGSVPALITDSSELKESTEKFSSVNNFNGTSDTVLSSLGSSVSKNNVFNSNLSTTVTTASAISLAATSSSVGQTTSCTSLPAPGFTDSSKSITNLGTVTSTSLNFPSSSITMGNADASVSSAPVFGTSMVTTVPKFSAPITTSTEKNTLSFGPAVTPSPVFVPPSSASPLTSGSSVMFGGKKSQPTFNAPATIVNTFGTNPSNFGTSAFQSFGATATVPQAFGDSGTTSFVPTASIGITTAPSFGVNTQSFVSSPSSGPFNAKPAEDTNKSIASTPFAFSSSAANSRQFSFGNTVSSAPDGSSKAPSFNFGAASSSSTQSATGAQGPGFTFSFGSNQATGATPGHTVFGSNTNPTPPAFGSSASSGFTTPAFFGSSSQTANNLFGFSSSQGTAAQQPAQSPAQPFGFAASSQTVTPPTFNPNAKPTFNFTGGTTPSFTADITSSAPPQRRIKKAVRRTQQQRPNVL